MRRALGLGDALTPPPPSLGSARAAGTTRVVDWRHGAGDHTTIAAAIAAAQPGERILIRRGIYTESLTIDKPLELVGDNERDAVTIEARDDNVIRWSANNGLISNLTLRQLGGNYYCVSIIQGAPDVEDCDISSQGNACLAIQGAGARPHVRRNRIHDGKTAGVYVCAQAQGTLEDNDIFANALAGIGICENSAPTVRGNRINKNLQVGIHIHDGGGGVIEQNDLRDNTRGAWFVADESVANVTRRDNQE